MEDAAPLKVWKRSQVRDAVIGDLHTLFLVDPNQVSGKETLTDLFVDSLEAIELTLEVSGQFGVDDRVFDGVELNNRMTVDEFCEAVCNVLQDLGHLTDPEEAA